MSRPRTCLVTANVALQQKSLEAPDLEDEKHIIKKTLVSYDNTVHNLVFAVTVQF